MKVLRIVSLLLALLLLGGCAVVGDDTLTDPSTEGSTPTDTEGSTPADTEAEDTEAPVEYIDLVVDGKPQFVIVSKGEAYLDAANSLKTLLDGKTGVTFTMKRFDPAPDEAGKIYVGCDWCEVTGSKDAPKYGYYGVAWENGNLYLCGTAAAEVEQCVSIFASSITKEHITKDDGGKVQVSIPTTLMFLKEPGGNEDDMLLGSSLQAYRIVHSAHATGLEKYFVMCLQEQLQRKGYDLSVVTDATAPNEREIVVGNTTRAGSAEFYGASHEPDEYAIVGKGTSLYIGYGSELCLQGILSSFSQAYGKETVSIKRTINGIEAVQRKNETDIRVMTTNVLYADWQAGALENADYALRMQMTAEYINLYRPDFVGLQEAREKNQAALTPHLDERYELVDFSEYSDETVKLAYLPVLYDADKWTVLDAAPGNWEHKLFCAWGYSWVKFARVGNETEVFYLMNLHYMPDTFVDHASYPGQYYRLDMAGYVNEEVKRIVAEDPDAMIAITGDYNAARESDVFESMYRNGYLESSCMLTEDTNMLTAQKRTTIDHISVTKDHTEVVRHRKIDTFGSEYMSDHQYQFCDLRRKSAVSS